MIILKKEYLVMIISLLTLLQKVQELQQKKDINIRFLKILIMKFLNIENILTMFHQLIIQKFLVYIQMQILLLDLKNQLK